MNEVGWLLDCQRKKKRSRQKGGREEGSKDKRRRSKKRREKGRGGGGQEECSESRRKKRKCTFSKLFLPFTHSSYTTQTNIQEKNETLLSLSRRKSMDEMKTPKNKAKKQTQRRPSCREVGFVCTLLKTGNQLSEQSLLR